MYISTQTLGFFGLDAKINYYIHVYMITIQRTTVCSKQLVIVVNIRVNMLKERGEELCSF